MKGLFLVSLLVSAGSGCFEQRFDSSGNVSSRGYPIDLADHGCLYAWLPGRNLTRDYVTPSGLYRRESTPGYVLVSIEDFALQDDEDVQIRIDEYPPVGDAIQHDAPLLTKAGRDATIRGSTLPVFAISNAVFSMNVNTNDRRDGSRFLARYQRYAEWEGPNCSCGPSHHIRFDSTIVFESPKIDRAACPPITCIYKLIGTKGMELSLDLDTSDLRGDSLTWRTGYTVWYTDMLPKHQPSVTRRERFTHTGRNGAVSTKWTSETNQADLIYTTSPGGGSFKLTAKPVTTL